MYKFIKEQNKDNEFDNTRVEFQTDAETLPELLEAFQYFLKGCGYQFDGEVYILDDEEL